MLPSTGSSVQCIVVHSLPDMIVVSFETQDQKVFQGALLCMPSSNSFSRPYGVCSTKEAFSEKLNLNNPRDYKMNSFFTLQKRHTYFQNSKPQSVSLNLNPKRQVRLRARRVVCHRCKNVCSESGRNAQFGGQQDDNSTIRKRSSSKLRSPPLRSKFNELCVKTFTLVPKIKRLGENEIRKFDQLKCDQQNYSGNATNNSLTPLKIKVLANNTSHAAIDTTSTLTASNKSTLVKIKLLPCGANDKTTFTNPGDPDDESSDENSYNIDSIPPNLSLKPEPSRDLRRKRCAVGSMEDLWDEHVFEEPLKLKTDETPLNVSAILRNFSSEKAAKKALKKAKKEAKKITNNSRRKKSVKIMSPSIDLTEKEELMIHSEEKSTHENCTPIGQQQQLGSKITVGDIVWANVADEFWWPAKVTNRSSSNSLVEVHWFNRDSGSQPIKIAANLIKPFMDMIQVGI